MRKLIFFSVLCGSLLTALCAGGEELTAARLFVEAPTSVFPTIDRMTRLDMIDYFESGSDKPSKNKLNGECRITAMNAEQLTFETSKAAYHTVSILPKMKGDTLVMVITTLKLPQEDSHVKFYTTSWKPVENRGLFMVPNLNDWQLENASLSKDDMENAFPMTIASASYEPGSGTLTITNNLQSFVPQEVYNLVAPNLAAKLTYRWNGSSLEKVKEKVNER